jgi:Protein of unknown function (DUF1552)
MKNLRFSRRAMLKSVGASAAMLPLLHAERAPAATASGFPKRFVSVVFTNGIVASDFYPSGADLTIGTTLKPLEAFKAKMVMPVGLDYTVVLNQPVDRVYDGHFTYPSLLTGTAETKVEGKNGMGPSLDQVLSDNIAKQTALTAPLINIGVRSEGEGTPSSWRAANQKNTNEIDPTRLFARLFAGSALPPAQIDVLRLRRQSVLDYVSKDLTGFSLRLGTDDKFKIQAHMDSIRQLEMQLGGPSAMPGMAVACTKPAAPATGKLDTPTLMKSMFDLAAVALRCDLTRVVTFDLFTDTGGSGNTFPWLGINKDYHTIAHDGAASATQKMQIDAWIFSQIANLVGQLDATVEGAGTALDNSVILVASDMNEGALHYVGKIPFLVIGGAGGALKTGGRVVRYSKIPHNRLLATLSTAMDMPVTGFGDKAYPGTLPELGA